MFRPMTAPHATSRGLAAALRLSPATLAAAGAGLMAATALPPFRHTGPLMVPALALLFWAVLRAPSPWRTAWAFGAVHQLALLHWLYFLGDAAPIASRTLVPVSATAAVLYASLYAALWGGVVGLVRRRLGVAAALVLIPLSWFLTEWLRSVGELAFPWCLTGAAVLTTDALHLAAAAGEAGLGAWLAAAGATVAAFALRRGREAPAVDRVAFGLLGLTVVGAVLIATHAGTGPVDPAAPELRVAVVQPDVALQDKWDPARRDSTIVPYTELSQVAVARGADLLVWAETAVPAYLRYDRPLRRWVSALADSLDTSIFLGHPEMMLGPDGERLRYNGASLYGPDGVRSGGYLKHHLLPFGEVMPFQRLIPALGKLDLGQAEWQVGPAPAPIPLPVRGDTLRFAALICYEGILPELARDAVNAGAGLLVNITNDGWFGDSAGPRQHAAMARLRAAECGVPMIRCANNGESFLADAQGRILSGLPLGARDVALATVRPGPAGTTYLRHGDRPVHRLLTLWTMVGLILALKDRRRG